MILSFKDPDTEDVFNGRITRKARLACPIHLWETAFRRLDQLDAVVRLDELRVPPGNRLEPLHGDRRGQHSLRINRQYRICFTWTDAGPADVEITDYHK